MDQIKTEIRIKLLPRSSRNEISGFEKNVCRVKVTAPPVDGKANKALIGLLAKRLGIAKEKIGIVRGERARLKTLLIDGLAFEDIKERLKA